MVVVFRDAVSVWCAWCSSARHMLVLLGVVLQRAVCYACSCGFVHGSRVVARGEASYIVLDVVA